VVGRSSGNRSCQYSKRRENPADPHPRLVG
jgi:hypothetical protein